MRVHRLLSAAGLLVTAIVSASGFQSSILNRQWPPDVQKVGDESPVLSPEDELKTFFMPPGYRVELVASEPLIQEPVALDWDTEGRLWAVEMPGFMADITGSNEHEPIGRVVVLEDTDRDGRMDKRHLFADGLILARSLKVLDRGVLVAEPPNVWFMRDTNGDLRMDTKELVTKQYGRFEGDPQNNANGFLWGLDNTMHVAGQSDIQLRLKDGVFEVKKTLQRGEWGVTQDDAGRIYRNTNESALHVDLVPTAYFARNPNLLRTRGSYERLADDNPELNTVWPVRPNPGTNRAYQTGIDRADGTLAKFTSVCAPVVYRGDRLPSELYGNVFVAEPAANLVGRLVLEDGARLGARKAYEKGDFLASTDERFRPVFISNAPDGTLYIADLYRGIIEHRISITVYLRDQIQSRKLDRPTGLGRIFRVVHDTTKRDMTMRPSGKMSQTDLVSMLSHPNGWWRDTAHRLLVERGAKPVEPQLTKLARSATDPRTRLHALWVLDGIDAIQPATVIEALNDSARDIRLSAIRIAERWLGDAKHPIHAAVVKRVDDGDPAVRRQLAASLGVMPPSDARTSAFVTLLSRNGDDPVTVDAALSGLRGNEQAILERLLSLPLAGNGSQPSGLENAVSMLAATIVRSAQDGAIQTVFSWLADGQRDVRYRSALLLGAEVALLGTTPPGTVVRRSVDSVATGLPCPTCPGGRAGPGGAYAFQRPGDPTMLAGRGRGAGRSVRLNREPAALSKLAAGGDEIATRTKLLLERIGWPGKPGEAEPMPPLTVEEQKRYEAGQEVYRNICQGCHQPDGRGQEKLAPSLVGSALALAPAEITTRVLLNGKEGSIGLMPPIGSTITDEQIAGVLTYVRREWGQTGTPVDPATVAGVRAATKDRTRPWTDAELSALMPKQH